MIPMLMLALGGPREVVTQSFAANTTWTAPAGVTVITTLTGKGAAGSPASSGINHTYSKHTTINAVRRSDGGITVFDGGTTTNISGIAPADYCDPFVDTPSDPTYSGNRTCYDFTDTSTSYSNPATTGASATGFGKTFPGGTGGPAAPVTFNNVAVTPGANYSLVIPSGGSISITYLK